MNAATLSVPFGLALARQSSASDDAVVRQVPVSISTGNIDGGDGEMSSRPSGNNFHREHPQNLVDFNALAARALRESFPGHSAKQIARLVGRSPATVEGWLAGRHAPHSFDLHRMARECAARGHTALQSFCAELAGISQDVLRAQELDRRLNELHRVTSEWIARRQGE